MESIVFDERDSDAWVCICGNRPHSDGFYPCDRNGKEVEPTETSGWDGASYVCGRCGRIINQDTLEVMGRRRKA